MTWLPFYHNVDCLRTNDYYDEEIPPLQDPASKHGMKLAQQNRLEIDPGWCYGRQAAVLSGVHQIPPPFRKMGGVSTSTIPPIYRR